MPKPPPTFKELVLAFNQTTLFQDKTWQLSPEPWPLTPKQLKEVELIGQACHEFYHAIELLYTRSWQDKNLLRNRELHAPWVAKYLDRGKPQDIIDYGRDPAFKGQTPVVIRPDLLLTEDGFAVTEIDAVPGGVGLTAFLNRLYAESCPGLIGSGDAMVDGFYASMKALVPEVEHPLIAIAVSDEAEVYRPEFGWLAQELSAKGHRAYCFHPDELLPMGDELYAPIEGNPEKVDVLYRFFELFDLDNIPIAEAAMKAARQGNLALSPPMKTYQEEKMSLGLFHHHLLGDFWRENLSRKSWKVLNKVVPKSWIMDPVELPPNAVLDAPWVGGAPIHRWEKLGEASQKERSLIIKASGFHETAWGARSVTLGSDVSRKDWENAIARAVTMSDEVLHVLQEYRKPMRLRHVVFDEEGEPREQEGRLRLCPYYFVEGNNVSLNGCLATFCPADKKIIHGMRDAAMLPTCVADE